MALNMKETMSMDLKKGTEHTIILLVISIKDSGRMAKKKGMEYTHTRVEL